MDYRILHAKTVVQLRALAKEEGIKIPAGAAKAKIIELLLEVENGRAAEFAQRRADEQRNAEQKLLEKQKEKDAEEQPVKKRGRPPKEGREDKLQARRGRPPKAKAPETEGAPVAEKVEGTEGEAPAVPQAEPQSAATAPATEKPAVNAQEMGAARIRPDAAARSGRPRMQPSAVERQSARRAYEPSRPAVRPYQENGRSEEAARAQRPAADPAPRGQRPPENRPDQPRFYRRENYIQDPAEVTQAVSDLLAAGDCAVGGGVLEPMPDGYGFLRAENYQQGTKDVYVSAAQIRRFDLRMGDLVIGRVRPQREGDRYTGLLFIDTINGEPPEKVVRRPRFEDLTPVYPQKRIRLEGQSGRNDTALRLIDMLAPIGRGQRAMIVSQPKAGKTVLLKKIANAITENEPDIELIVLLIDERPEEVTDMQRSIKGDVVYSTFDELPENHAQVAEMALQRAQRLVEQGKDVVILLDSITRLARAYNLVVPPTGRTLSGGMDPGALHKPKRFFGAARNIENGGSLTIIATALVETGSRMDDVIFEEFKGTGNSEIHLDRKLSEKRIFPAIDMNKSGTRREDLLLTQEEADGALAVRRMLSAASNQDAVEQLLTMLHKTDTNAEFFQLLKSYFAKLEKGGFVYGSR